MAIDLVVYVGFGASSVGSYLCMVEGRARTDGILLGYCMMNGGGFQY